MLLVRCLSLTGVKIQSIPLFLKQLLSRDCLCNKKKTNKQKKNNRNNFFRHFVGLHARINWQTKILLDISGG